jgi:hypothetical protein
MGWEERAGRRYYYRKRRRGREVRSEYVGTGELADAIASLDALKRSQLDLARVETQEERKVQDDLDAWLDQFLALTRMVMSQVLMNSGYHQHRGQWRRVRNE